MKKNRIFKTISGVALCTVLLTGCSESWLEPKPLSFLTPENAYVDADGLLTSLAAAERSMRHEYFGNGSGYTCELIFSDLCISGTTDKAGPLQDMDRQLMPDANFNNAENSYLTSHNWDENWNQIKYTNVVLSRMKDTKFVNEAEKNKVLGTGYFQRCYRYWRLINQFGDVPFIDVEVTYPRYDFNTCDRWSILRRMKKELEFAYQWVPEQVDRGHTTKSACGVLLMKVYMSLGEFDNAIKVGNEIVAKHPLMVNRFTSTKNNHPNLMFDLHSVEAKSDPANTEGILYGVSEPNNASGTGSAKTEIMANCVPMWNNNVVKTPSGKTGFAVTPDSKDVAAGIVEDVNKTYGRGIARVRPTNYFQYTIWTEKEKNDLRGRYNHDSWRRMEDLIYNNPTLKKANDPWYGKKAVKPVNMSCGDSIRCWFSWPHYKVYIPDPTAGSGQWKGGSSPIYLMRSAEVYLMLAECYYWKDNLGEAANMLNVVRKRAGADLLTAQDINIGEILNERARELYYEEHRHITLVRIAYTYALTGKPCEIFDGRIYKMENLCGPKGASNLKDAGYNFWFDWISQHNNFYNKGVKNRFAEYTMSVHHMLWPIPNKDIRANTNGHINQNNGYLGCENNVTPLQVPEEGQFMKD